MKIVVAFDSFKGSMSSHEAGTIVADALGESLTEATITVIPIADGGEGTTDAVFRAVGGELRQLRVTGPLGEPATASFALLPGGGTAVLDVASASGIGLVPAGRLDPMRATSYGTGELLGAAIATGAREIIVGLGGSATVDGGTGMAQALGYRLSTAAGEVCGRGGAALAKVARIDPGSILPELAACRVRGACDVTSPLLGVGGAARVFGPQKGASPDDVKRLERGLENLASLWLRQGFLTAVDHSGDGAAGGLGAGLRAFCGAELLSGAELLAEITGFEDAVRDADLVVTGEGTSDAQTLSGKLCAVLAAMARRAGARTVLISGSIRDDFGDGRRLFDATFATADESCPREEAMKRGREALSATARMLGRQLAVGAPTGQAGGH